MKWARSWAIPNAKMKREMTKSSTIVILGDWAKCMARSLQIKKSTQRPETRRRIWNAFVCDGERHSNSHRFALHFAYFLDVPTLWGPRSVVVGLEITMRIAYWAEYFKFYFHFRLSFVSISNGKNRTGSPSADRHRVDLVCVSLCVSFL